MKKTKSQKTIETKYESLDQHDYFWVDDEDELIMKKEEMYASYIGKYLIWFSSLEHTLDIRLADCINEHMHDFGYLVIKNLGMRKKIDLFYNFTFLGICMFEETKEKHLKELESLRRRLVSSSELRNRIAHAKWHTLDKEGYVRTDTKTSKEDGFIKFKKLKITPIVMLRGIQEIKRLTDDLDDVVERMHEEQGKDL